MYNNIYKYEFIDINNINKDLLNDIKKDLKIETSKQKTGYGYRLFFVCPKCGKRKVKLYKIPDYYHYLCRECLKLSYPRQQIYDENLANVITINMLKILGLLKVKDKWNMLTRISYNCLDFPKSADGSHLMLLIEKPKGMHYKTYYKYIKRLFRLELARVDFIYFKNKKLWNIYKTFVRDGIW